MEELKNEIIKRLLEETKIFFEAPNECDGEENNTMLFWGKKEHHLELEIFKDKIKAFYKNNNTDHTWHEELTMETLNCPELIKYLSYFKCNV